MVVPFAKGKSNLKQNVSYSDGFDQDGCNKNGFDIQRFDQSGIVIYGFNRSKELTDDKEQIQQAIWRNPWNIYCANEEGKSSTEILY